MAARGSDVWRKDNWSKPCAPPGTATIALHGGSAIVVDARTADAWRALNTVLVRFDYRPKPATTGALVCRHMRHDPSAPMSAHSWGLAGDLSWDLNPPGSRLVTNMSRAMVDAILAIRTTDGVAVFRWGGDWDGRPDTPHGYYDAMHFEVVATPAELARGIATTDDEEDVMKLNDTGRTVAFMQSRLREVVASCPVNSTYDVATQAAVRQFQELPYVGLDVTGEWGPAEWAALTLIKLDRTVQGAVEDEARKRESADSQLFDDQVTGPQARRWFARRHKAAHDGTPDDDT